MYKLNVAESLTFFFSWIRRLVLLNLTFLILLSLYRISAWLYYSDSEGLTGHFMDSLDALLLGARFDLSFLAIISFIPIIWLITLTLKRHERSLENFGQNIRPYYLILFLLINLFFAVDMIGYGHLKDHLDISWFTSFGQDPENVFSSLLEGVSSLLLVVGIIIALIFALIIFKTIKSLLQPFRLKQSFIQKSSFNYAPAFLLTLLVTLACAWGSISEERLTPAEASFSKNSFVNFLAGNGIYFLAQAYETPKSEMPELQKTPYTHDQLRETYDLLHFNPTESATETQPKDQQ